MDRTSMLLHGIGLPALVSTVLAWALACLAPRLRRQAGLTESIALAAGFVAAWVPAQGMPRVPAVSTEEWVPLFALLAPLLLLGERTLPAAMGRGLRIAALAAVCLLTARPLLPGFGPLDWLRPVLLTGLALVHRAEVARMPDPERAWLLPAISGATALALGLSGTVTLGTAAGALAVSQAALLGLQLLSPARCAPGEATTLPTLVLFALWLNGAWYNSLSYVVLVLLAAAPLAFRLPGTPRRVLGRSTRTWIAVLVLAIAVAIPLRSWLTSSSGW